MQAPTCQAQSQAQHLQRLQQSSTARPSHAYPCSAPQTPAVYRTSHRSFTQHAQQLCTVRCQATLTVEAPAAPAATSSRAKQGHAALLHGLGEVGNVKPTLMPWLLRLAHIRCVCSAHASSWPWSQVLMHNVCICCRSTVKGGDSSVALQESARGVLLWEVSLSLLSSWRLSATYPYYKCIRFHICECRLP